MKPPRLMAGLAIDSPLVSPTALNFMPPCWPPPDDFPVVIDNKGNVISRYGDPIWKLWPWAGRVVVLNFGDGMIRRGGAQISKENANLLRQVVAWWLYGPKGVRTAWTLRRKFRDIRPVFVLATDEGILATDIWRFPAVVDKLTGALNRSCPGDAFAELHRLYEQRDSVGLTLLDRSSLRSLEATIPHHENRQTPYIPPRIWLYQLNRLRAFLDDFCAHEQGVKDCYNFCLDAYATNYGSLANACGNVERLGACELPFFPHQRGPDTRPGLRFHGPFADTAKRFGIDGLLHRWILEPGADFDGSGRGIRLLGAYFTMVGYVGLAYLLNFSMMRIEEGWTLKCDCLEVENDDRFGEIYLLKGPTTKTLRDDDARWVTSPSARVAVSAMSTVARLRMVAAEASPDTPTTAEDLRNPHLVVRGHEPWANAKGLDLPLSARATPLSYKYVIENFPRLFDLEQLRITHADLEVARLVTPTLDAEAFDVEKIWPLAWHQLRRTGAVNMQASGLVSDASVQYQLKHATRAMALYYGQGYSRLRLNLSAQNEYIRTMYEVLGKEIAGLVSDRYVSPHGNKRKAEILRTVDPKDHQKLVADGKAGKISYRSTLLGGCTRIGPCDLGGVDNIVRCGGGDGRPPCADALYDQKKEPSIRSLVKTIDLRLLESPEDSPYRDSLTAQRRAAETALNVLSK